MLNKPLKLCKSCNKQPPMTWRRDCLVCINKKQKELAREKKTKEVTKVKVRKEKALDKKRFSRTKLLAEADRVASLFIRERDKGKPCVTCWTEWSETAQNWHFASRRHLSTRWLDKNMNWQCPTCNCWGAGEQFKHWKAIDKKYWEWTAEQIMRLANSVEKISDDEIIHYIRLYYYELSQMGWTNEMIGLKKYYLKWNDISL